MGHYESTQLRTGFWGSASVRDSPLLLPPWASPVAVFPSYILDGGGECCVTATREAVHALPQCPWRDSLSFDRQLLHTPSRDITAAEEAILPVPCPSG